MEHTETKHDHQSIRAAFWEQYGVIDSDVLAPIMGNGLTTGPVWPIGERYIAIRKENRLFFATDGLSDGFPGGELGNIGFGIELYIETTEDMFTSMTLPDIQYTPLMQLLQQSAMNAAQSGVFADTAEQYGVFSSALYDIEAPVEYLTQDGTVGVLFGVQSEIVASECMVGDRAVKMLSVTPLTAEETAFILEGGADARKSLVATRVADSVYNRLTA